MAVRNTLLASFPTLLRRHLGSFGGTALVVGARGASGCSRTGQEICVEGDDPVTEADVALRDFCDDNLNWELTSLEAFDSGEDGVQCATPVYTHRSRAGMCVRAPLPPFALDGRPLVIEGRAVTAEPTPGDAWVIQSGGVAGLGAAERVWLAARWRKAAAYEHASVASFARFVVDLMRFCAPPDLVAAATRAAGDEVRHAQLAYGLAASFDGRTEGPDALSLPAQLPLAPDLAAFAADTARDGCVGETLAAVRAAAARPGAAPEVRMVLDVLVAEESEHAALAWDAVAWAIDQGGETVRAAVAEAVAACRGVPQGPDVDGLDPALLRLGGVDAAAELRAVESTWTAVIEPALAELGILLG